MVAGYLLLVMSRSLGLGIALGALGCTPYTVHWTMLPLSLFS